MPGLLQIFGLGKLPLVDKAETIADGDTEYDVVIIGGGTAGCVLAARISENPSVRVLLLEAGESSRDVLNSKIPATFGLMFLTERDYGLWTEPQANANNSKVFWPRGKMLGGCSSLNALMFHAGSPTDYDEWAQTGQDGAEQWSHEKFLPYFRKFETFVPSSQYPDVDRSMRGTNGPVKVGYYGYLHDVCAKWIDSCRNVGIPFNPDVNHPTAGTLGVTKIMTYIDPSGKRVSTETAYLTPEVLRRPNLKVAIHTQVTRVLFDTRGGMKKAIGVEFAREKGGRLYQVRAKNEVVLSAGAVHSPHILMLSGVGPKAHLERHNIPLVHDLPGVGQKLQDHLVISTRYRVKPGRSLQYILAEKGIGVFWTVMAAIKWALFGTGPLTSNFGEAAAFIRSDDTHLFPSDSYRITDTTSGSKAPDIETICNPLGLPGVVTGRDLPEGEFITIGTVLLRPQSWGTISLKSRDPFDAPLIDPRYFSTKNDMSILVRGVKLALRLTKTEPLASEIERDENPLLDHRLDHLSDTELEDELRGRPETLFHPTSTCRMAKLEDGGVVDASLRVHGIQNLRIADASIFPYIPAGHTAAPSIAVGEKASDIIKESLKLLGY